jgi:hypothetical protein
MLPSITIGVHAGLPVGVAVAVGVADGLAVGVGEANPQGLTGQLKISIDAMMTRFTS